MPSKRLNDLSKQCQKSVPGKKKNIKKNSEKEKSLILFMFIYSRFLLVSRIVKCRVEWDKMRWGQEWFIIQGQWR